MRLNDKVVVVTGGASGIGRATTLLFAAEGAKVVVVDLNEKAGLETVRLTEEKDGVVTFCKADVSTASGCESMVKIAEQSYGRLDVLFNNAGIMHKDDHDAIQTDEAVWDLTMNVNLKSVFLGCKFGIPALRRSGGGSIINTASFVALMGAATPQLAYTASKGGVLALSRELAIVHAREHIRVNALCPG
ncbi:MAG TPA: short-chain dehydrogenase, partial [Acidobacteria bacterium]|nr:short-chain dehydrogenase [Acidobacteriota bacterium]